MIPQSRTPTTPHHPLAPILPNAFLYPSFLLLLFRHTWNPSPALSVPPGTRITHKTFGSGTVEQQDGDTLEIRFSDGSLRKLSAAYCVRHHLIVQ